MTWSFRRAGGSAAGSAQHDEVFQSYAVWPHMTVAAERRLRPRAAPGRPATSSAAAASLRSSSAAWRALSGRALRRPAAARRPGPGAGPGAGVLLLDEPLSNLDANLREEMRFEIRRLQTRAAITSIYVTHDQAEAMTSADGIAVMSAGGWSRSERRRTSTSGRARRSSRASSAAAMSSRGRRSTNPTFHTRVPRCDAPAAGSWRAAPVRWRSASTWSGCGPRSPTRRRTWCRERWCGRSFSGSGRDYLVEMPDRTQLRVVASAAENIPQGAAVWLHLPPESCRVLSG